MDRADLVPAGRAGRGGGADERCSVLEASSRSSFGSTPALRGADLAIAEGEVLADHGAERVRASRPCCTAWPASSCPTRRGQLRRAGASTRWARRSAARCAGDRFGFVFQFGQLVPELTAEENVALPLLLGGVAPGGGRAAGRGLVRAARARRAGGAPPRRAVRRPGPAGGARPRPGRQPAGGLRRRADRGPRLAHRRAGDGAAGRPPRATRARPSSLVTHEPRSRPTPTARSSCATAGCRRRAAAAMIRLGLRLTFAGGREAGCGCSLIAVAVALGMAMLLTAWRRCHAFKPRRSLRLAQRGT